MSTETIRMISDRLAEATTGFGVMADYNGLPMAARSVFLIDGDSVQAAWKLTESPLPDIDAIIAAASSS